MGRTLANCPTNNYYDEDKSSTCTSEAESENLNDSEESSHTGMHK